MRDNAAKVGELQQQLEESQRKIKELQGTIAKLREALEGERISNSELQDRPIN